MLQSLKCLTFDRVHNFWTRESQPNPKLIIGVAEHSLTINFSVCVSDYDYVQLELQHHPVLDYI